MLAQADVAHPAKHKKVAHLVEAISEPGHLTGCVAAVL